MEAVDRLGVRIHGINLTLQVNNPRLIDYARDHLGSLIVAPVEVPDLLVRCHWRDGEWDPEGNPFPTDGPLHVVGNRMLGSSDELVWLDTLRMKGLQLRFRRREGRFVFDVAYRFHAKEGKVSSLLAYEHKKYFSLMRYLVYHPLIWYLERSRGWTLLHASALDSVEGGIIIGGLAGVGKSTTCVALTQRPGITLVSENLLLTDGEYIYSCYEPIRLDQGSLAALGEGLTGLTRMPFPEEAKEKWLFRPTDDDLPERVKPAVLFLPRFAPRRYLRQLAPDLAAEKVIAINGLVRELDDYNWYASALNMTWPRTGQAAQRVAVLGQLCRTVLCFELGIDRSAGVEAVVEDILTALAQCPRPLAESRR